MDLNFDSQKIYISTEYIDENKYITEKEIEDVNKLVGIKNFIYYPQKSELECGSCDDFIETIIIPIMIDVFSSGLFEVVKLAVIELYKRIRTKIKQDEEVKCNFNFRIYDEKSGFKLDLSSDIDASAEEIETLLDKAKEIVEIVKR